MISIRVWAVGVSSMFHVKHERGNQRRRSCFTKKGFLRKSGRAWIFALPDKLVLLRRNVTAPVHTESRYAFSSSHTVLKSIYAVGWGLTALTLRRVTNQLLRQ